MYGLKNLFTLFMMVIFFFVLKLVKRDKNENNFNKFNKNDKNDPIVEHTLAETMKENHENLLKQQKSFQKLLLHDYENDKCFIFHTLMLKPDNLNIWDYDQKMKDDNLSASPQHSNLLIKRNMNFNGNDKEIMNDDKNIGAGKDREQISASSSMNVISRIDKNIQHQRTGNNTSPVVYLFVVILIVSLIKAALDLSKQIKKPGTSSSSTSGSTNDLSRRCSLQDFTMSRHERKQQQQQENQQKFFQFVRRSTVPAFTSSPSHVGSSSPIKCYETIRVNHLMRQFSNGSSGSSSGIISEPSSPAKTNKLLIGSGGRTLQHKQQLPPPLLRRSSFPVAVHQHLTMVGGIGGGNKSRRPSMDSFSEDDSSSPDVKRRVRMIHRH